MTLLPINTFPKSPLLLCFFNNLINPSALLPYNVHLQRCSRGEHSFAPLYVISLYVHLNPQKSIFFSQVFLSRKVCIMMKFSLGAMQFLNQWSGRINTLIFLIVNSTIYHLVNIPQVYRNLPLSEYSSAG